MGSAFDLVTPPSFGNVYIDSLVGDRVFKPGTTITYALEGKAGSQGFGNDGGQLWRSGGAYTAFTKAVAAWNAVCDIHITPWPFYYNGSGGRDAITWVEQIGFLGSDNPELGQHDFPADLQQVGIFNSQNAHFTAEENAVGGFNFVTFLHETGHGLGLNHPHDGSPLFPGVTADSSIGDLGLNQGIFTVMSYNDGYNGTAQPPSHDFGYMTTPGAFDIAAVQAIYGVNKTTAVGDTVYMLPTVNGAGTGFSCIWDAGGIDTIDASGAANICVIDLRAATLQREIGGGGFVSNALNIAGGLTIAHNAVIENAIGGAFNDFITGNVADNWLSGGGGDDRLVGGDGNDRLDGGDGADSLEGGNGNDQLSGGWGFDTYYVDSASDVTIEAAGAEIDAVFTTVSYYLYDNVENLTLSGTAGAAYGVGNASDNFITGNVGDNLLIGGAGNDQLDGGDGNDALFGEAGADRLNGGGGVDYLAGGAGNDTLYGSNGADALYGEDGNDTLDGGSDFVTDILVGGAGNDSLRGDSGAGDYDLLDGGSGDDVYYVDTPADLTFEATGGGIDTVVASIFGAGYYLFPNVENLTLAGGTPFGVGNELNNILIGSAASNYLLGGAGNDTLDGRNGDDVLFGEAGADVFVFTYERNPDPFAGATPDFGLKSGRDVIGDFQPGVDHIRLVGQGFTSFAQVRAAFVENDGTTAIDLGHGDFVVLNGIANAQLSSVDFIFG